MLRRTVEGRGCTSRRGERMIRKVRLKISNTKGADFTSFNGLALKSKFMNRLTCPRITFRFLKKWRGLCKNKWVDAQLNWSCWVCECGLINYYLDEY